ncbi:hypothetical protein BDR04DRAFT_1110709 [Suillus decipiens]|nr:hypothetical protein BDR04DRAFT_1110709 [Suillus decipiens]
MLLTGSFSTKNKDDLIDIAGALQIFTVGTKPEFLKAIKEYFESHPELKTDERFSSLFLLAALAPDKNGPSMKARLMTPFRMSPLPHALVLILVIPILHCMQDRLPAILSQAFLPLTLLPTILTHLIHT